MSLARTLTFFVVDISPSMGRTRTVVEEFFDSKGEVEQRERTVTNLEWCLEFVSRKTQALIFSGLKTATMGLMTFGSTRTNNAIVDADNADDAANEGYAGIDEIAQLGQPTVATLELLRLLRACGEDEGGHDADPLDALICALTSLSDKNRGGQSASAKSYKKTIYLITDARHRMNKDSVDAIATKIRDERVSLRVIGVDFDDEEFGFKEPKKDTVKAENEAWWHSWLTDLPESRIATAAHAIEQATLPNVQMQGSAPYSSALTFGDPDNRYSTGGVMHIPIKMYKLTTRVLPMARKTMSKLAEQAVIARQGNGASPGHRQTDVVPSSTPMLSSTDVSDGLTNTYLVDTRRLYFLAEEAKEHGTEHAEALPEGAENSFSKAYKLGASVIPITSDLDIQWESKSGLEIIHWVKESTFRRQYLLADIWNIFADAINSQAQVQLSSLSMAMKAQGKYALVRFVRRANAEPKLGVLHPVTRSDEDTAADYFHFSEIPFSDDLKRYTFPSLDRVITADGKVLKDHRTLPTDKMVSAMEGLIDSMDLMHAFKDEEGQGQAWFSTEDSFNPAIHRMKEAVAYRVMHPDSKDLPRPHWEVDKFLDRPGEIREASEPWADKCKKAFMIRYYPDKSLAKVKQKRERDAAAHAKRTDARYELDLGQAGADSGDEAEGQNDAGAEKGPATSDEQKRFKNSQGQSQPVKGKLIDEDEGDESEEEDMLAPRRKTRDVKEEPDLTQKTPEKKGQPSGGADGGETNGKDGEQEDEEDGEAPESSIKILESDPVGSFLFHLEDPKMDQGAVLRALQKSVLSLISSSSVKKDAARKAHEALRAGKKAAAEYDEAEEWNAFVRGFKSAATSSTSSGVALPEEGALAYLPELRASEEMRAFWQNYCVGDTSIGLITKEEDEGLRSRVEQQEAQEFVSS
ncbi:SPOC domain-like protein [Microstroma glucosiphilum]|uniref:ATP-dependent DNA helicase II subunit 2 n=1 Tax=Pseudomicrostroma glucosiphilum TaxID=1684307 RepID=A0A316UF35_9BASI|nr:SPOC domain-like protein [Pseudomicrostroma glucosiphilum]PWN23548.1 SPOC domain-like protein [Pseudomicrostroma glucosiphilum]